jgi:hypothetical protein
MFVIFNVLKIIPRILINILPRLIRREFFRFYSLNISRLIRREFFRFIKQNKIRREFFRNKKQKKLDVGFLEKRHEFLR